MGDGGHTWKLSPSLLPGLDETTVAQLPNGSVMLNARHQNTVTMGRAIDLSNDGGATWGPIGHDARLPGAVCQGSMVSFNGAVYYSNPKSVAVVPYKNADSGTLHLRQDLSVQCSVDSTAHWASGLHIETEPSFGYSCLLHGPVRNLPEKLHGKSSLGGILYESRMLKGKMGFIRFATFPIGLGDEDCLLDLD